MDAHPNAPVGVTTGTNGHGGSAEVTGGNAGNHPVATVPKAPMVTGGKIAPLIPQTFDEVWRVATLAVKSGLTPRDIKTPERAAMAILHGMELRLPPMMALQRIAVINGRPSVWGDAVPAIALATGELQNLIEVFEGKPFEDDYRAVCRVTRRVNGTAVIEKEATFSVADAKAANLWDEREKVQRRSQDGGGTYEVANDSPWHRFPKRMLQMRARVAVRDLFADAMCGLYIAEELVGRDTSAEMRDITPAAHEIVHNPLGGEDADMNQDPPTHPRSGVTAEAAQGGGAGAFTAGQGGGRPSIDNASPGPADAAGGARKGKSTSARKGKVVEANPDAAPAEGETRNATSAEQDPPPAEEKFPEPWNRQSPEAYVSYALGWIGRCTSHEAARTRWTNERNIRNGLASPIPPDLLKQCQDAMAKVGKS